MHGDSGIVLRLDVHELEGEQLAAHNPISCMDIGLAIFIFKSR